MEFVIVFLHLILLFSITKFIQLLYLILNALTKVIFIIVIIIIQQIFDANI